MWTRGTTLLFAVAVHGALAWGSASIGAARTRTVRHGMKVSHMVEVEMEPPPPEPVVEPEPPPAPKPKPKPKPRPKKLKEPAPPPIEDAPTAEEANEPAEAAKAGQVLAAKTPQVLDFTNTMVVGKADRYAGGTTASEGTSDKAARDPNARAGGSLTGSGPAKNIDRSRGPSLAGGHSWRDCGFPRRATFAGVKQASVTLHLTVGSNGKVSAVRVLDDPGHGFGEHAARCARKKPWNPALDRMGKPTRWSQKLRVRFVR